MHTICAMRFGQENVVKTIALVVGVAVNVGERITDSATALAVGRRHRERALMHRLPSTFQSNLALLDRADTFNCRDLVFAATFEASVAARPPAWLCRRHCFFHDRI